jgi:AraC-like DNA-binding protein
MTSQDGVAIGSSRSFLEPDEFHAAIRGGNGILSLLGNGTYAANLTTIRVGRLTLQRGRENLSRISSSAMPPNRVGVLGWIGDSALPVVRGRQMRQGEWLCLGLGMQSQHRTSGPVDFVALTLDADDLARAATEISGTSLAITAGAVLHVPTPVHAWLSTVIEAATLAVTATPEIFKSPISADALEHALLRPMVMCLMSGQATQESNRHRRRVDIARQFLAEVETSVDCALSIPALARVLGVSQRGLRDLCEEQLGISPVRFVLLRRLHLTRRALLRSDHHTSSVTEIALDYGLWNLGRFAVTYKSVFGESPSATLRRPLGRAGGSDLI